MRSGGGVDESWQTELLGVSGEGGMSDGGVSDGIREEGLRKPNGLGECGARRAKISSVDSPYLAS